MVKERERERGEKKSKINKIKWCGREGDEMNFEPPCSFHIDLKDMYALGNACKTYALRYPTIPRDRTIG